MTKLDQQNVANRLLRLLSPKDFALLATELVPCEHERGAPLFEADEPIDTVWFIESGIGSLVTAAADGNQVETGLFGRDGFAPPGVVLGADRTPNRAFVQIAGSSLRLDAGALQQAVDRSPTLLRLLLRYPHTLAVQTDHTAVSNAAHPIDQRLARWLLMCHDRLDGGEMGLTHDFLALMLAVRRPSVTTALHVLEGKGLIRSERGCVIVRNRAALEEFAGAAYGAPEREYRRLIGEF